MDDYYLHFTVDGKEYCVGAWGGSDIQIELPIEILPEFTSGGSTRIRGSMHAAFYLADLRLTPRYKRTTPPAYVCGCRLPEKCEKVWAYCPNCGGAL